MTKKKVKLVLRNVKITVLIAVVAYLSAGATEIGKYANESCDEYAKHAVTVSTVCAYEANHEAIEMEAPVPKVEESRQYKYQTVMPNIDLDSDDTYLLAKIAMAEAEGEGVKGKALVMMVVLNRVQSDKFPNSVSDVIFQKGQFSPVSNGRYDGIEPDQECYEALDLILFDEWDESQGALYFENGSASDWHRNHLQFLFQYGNHYFYTERSECEGSL